MQGKRFELTDKLDPRQVCLVYFAACIAWIFLSDRMVAGAHLPTEIAFWISTLKGFIFVGATTALLYVVLKRDNEKIQAAHEASLHASLEIAHRLALAIELRDVCTSEHNERIATYCDVVGREMGLDAERLDQLVRAAPLHDVGKIAIPDSILEKPGRLTPEEMSVVRQHAVYGAKLLHDERNGFMALAALIAKTHHESWDGTGYPFGLKQEDIPLEGRIVAVCDVFDALLSERPYKRPWPFEEAVGEIRSLSGTKFDPAVVAAFERAIPHLTRAHHGVTKSFATEEPEVAIAAA